MIKKWLFFVLFLGVLISGNQVYSKDSFQDYINRGKDIEKKCPPKWLDLAAEEYWKALEAGGGEEAIAGLTRLYNGVHWATSYDWAIVRTHVQKAADAEFNRNYGPDHVERYDNTFFLIATESEIIEKYAIQTISKKWIWGGNTRVRTALKSLYKRYYSYGKKGRFTFRTQYLGSELGHVAILDKETAIRNFDLLTRPTKNWCIYVQAPYNSNVLIPFDSFHQRVYKDKMAAFQQICNLLGAKSLRAYYYQNDKDSVQVNVHVIDTLEGAQGEIKTQIDHSRSQTADYTMYCEGALIPTMYSKIRSPWLDSESDWKTMVEMRTNPVNPLKEYNARFTYLDDYHVNVETRAAFAKAGIQVGAGVDVKFDKSQKIVWLFHVEFHTPILVIDIPQNVP